MTVQGVKRSLFRVKRGLGLRVWLMLMARVRASRARRDKRRRRAGFAEPGLVACSEDVAGCVESARLMGRCVTPIEPRVGICVCI